MANNYLQPVNNHFDLNNDLDDIDDDTFLKSGRTIDNNTSAPPRSTNPFDEPLSPNSEQQQQAYAQKRREIENRTLESTQKSLGLLYETEEVGKATAVELAKQREQLEKTSRQLDEINSTLRFSQRHLTGLKSVFGSLKNYISGNRDPNMSSPRMTASPSGSQLSQETNSNNVQNCNVSMSSATTGTTAKPVDDAYDNHPVSRIRDDSTAIQQRQQQQQQRRNNPFESQIEANLEDMCENLSRLKFLATDLGSEIESQNELLDNMNYKIEDVDLKINKQNKDMNKLLKK